MENKGNSDTTQKLLELLGDKPIGQTSDGLPIYASESPYTKVGERGGDSLAEKCREIAQLAPEQPGLTLEQRIAAKRRSLF